MSRRAPIFAGLISAVFLAAAAPAIAQSGDPLIEVAPDDAAMDAAIASARASLPRFWARFDTRTPDYSDFMVKAGMTTVSGEGTEHIWIDLTDHRDGKVFGRLANDPVHLGEHLALGSEVEVSEEIISDWGYAKGEVLYGHFTTRVLAAMQGESLSAYGLSPNPLETETN